MLPCNFNHLYYFYRVAVHESVSKASKELLIAQSALSTQLKQLEEYMETTLFNRTKGGMALTERGKLVFKHTQKMFETYTELEHEMALAETQVKGPLNIGTVDSIGIYLLPELLAPFSREFPDVRIDLSMDTSSQVIEMLQENQVDVAFIAWDRKYPQLTSHVIMQNELILVGSPKHPLTKPKKLTLTDLVDNVMVGYEPGTPTRLMIDSQFKEIGLKPKYALESVNIGVMKHLVVEGMGLALLPEIAVPLELKEKMLIKIPLEGIGLERPITMYWKERRALARPAEEFIKYCQNRSAQGEF